MVQFYGNWGRNTAHESLHVMHGRHPELFYINILMKEKYQRKGSAWPSGTRRAFSIISAVTQPAATPALLLMRGGRQNIRGTC